MVEMTLWQKDLANAIAFMTKEWGFVIPGYYIPKLLKRFYLKNAVFKARYTFLSTIRFVFCY